MKTQQASVEALLAEIYYEIGTKVPGYRAGLTYLPVMIGDVLDWYEKSTGNYMKNQDRLNLLDLWEDKRLPIKSQSQYTVEHVHSLIPKK